MKIIFAGTPAFAAGFLEALVESHHEVIAVLTQPDKPGKRGKKLQPGPVKQLATAHGLPVLQPDKLRLEDIAHLECDLMLVVAFGQILKPDVLAYPRLGCINIHGSLLPRWRGAAPVQRAILAGDEKSGITLIQMDAGLDTGDMLAKTVVPISPTDTTADLFTAFTLKGKPLLLDTIEALERGDVTAEPQNAELATYAHKIRKTEALIDWTQDAEQVSRVVRAFNPDPVAFTFLASHRIKVHTGHVVDTGSKIEASAGKILELSNRGLLVGCGKNAFLIERIQLPVGKGAILSGAEMKNGWSDTLKTGSTFGDTTP